MRKWYVVETKHWGAPAYCKFNMLGCIEQSFYTADNATAFASYEAARYVADYAQNGTCHELEVVNHEWC